MATAIVPASQCDWFHVEVGGKKKGKQWRTMANGNRIFGQSDNDEDAVLALVKVTPKVEGINLLDKIKAFEDKALDAAEDCHCEILRCQQPKGSTLDKVTLITAMTNGLGKHMEEKDIQKCWESITESIKESDRVAERAIKTTSLWQCRAKYVVQDPRNAQDFISPWGNSEGKKMEDVPTDGIRTGTRNHIGSTFLYNLDQFPGYNHHRFYKSEVWDVVMDQMEEMLPLNTRKELYDHCYAPATKAQKKILKDLAWHIV